MLTALEVANLALANTGEGSSIASFDEDSTEARACKQYYLISRNTILKSFDWDFARKPDIPLVLVTPFPANGWNYGYAYPPDCLRLLSVGGAIYGRGIVGREDLILSNFRQACATYTSGDLIDRYPEDFGMAWSFRLAIMIAPQVTEGNESSLRKTLETGYKLSYDEAIENNSNEEGTVTIPSPAMDAGGWFNDTPHGGSIR